MTQSITAAVHIQGATIRYVELEQEDAALSLRRLDRKDVEFDVAQRLWGGTDDADALDQIRTVLRGVLEDSEASSVGLVAHPLDVYSFFMPVPTGLSDQARERHVAYQAALVTDTRSSTALHTSSQSVRTAERAGEEIEWLQVLAVPREVEDRFEALVSALPVPDAIRVMSPEAAAQVMQRRGGTEEASPEVDEEGYSLAIGAYPAHTEYALTRRGTWHHAHAAQEAKAPENRTYYAVGFLNRIEVPVSEIEDLFVYGPKANPDFDGALEAVFDRRPTRLDPLDKLGLTGEPSPEEAPSTYVPCIGGALRAQSP